MGGSGLLTVGFLCAQGLEYLLFVLKLRSSQFGAMYGGVFRDLLFVSLGQPLPILMGQVMFHGQAFFFLCGASGLGLGFLGASEVCCLHRCGGIFLVRIV